MNLRRTRYTKEQRHAMGWLNIREAAERIGVNPETFRYHVSKGYCRRPSKRIGNRLFYTKEVFPMVTEYWSQRERHQHHPRSYKFAQPLEKQ